MDKGFDKKRAHSTFYRVILTDRLHRSVVEDFLGETGIHRSQHMILMHLSGKGKYPSQKELAQHLKISPAAIAVSLKKLEEGGFIKRDSDKNDCRLNSIIITEKGMDIIEKSNRLFEECDYAMFKDFSEEEYDFFEACLEKISKGLEGYKSEICGKAKGSDVH